MATIIPVSNTKIAHNMHSLKRKTRSIDSYRSLRHFVLSRVERSETSIKDVEFLTSRKMSWSLIHEEPIFPPEHETINSTEKRTEFKTCHSVRSGGLWFSVLNATFKNISVISWRSVLLVEETGVPRENHRPVASHWQILSHNVV